MPQKQTKTSKLGRNKAKCERYRAIGQREKNKARKRLTIERRLEKARAHKGESV